MSRVTLTDVSFSYGRREIIHEVSWGIGPGVTGLLGPNGAGKTTLIRMLVGVARPSSGSIAVASDDGSVLERPRVGFVPQRFSVAGEMRAIDTVAYAAWINGISSRESMTAAHRALDLVSLTELAKARVRKLSGGQRQRLGLAAALAHRPDFLVLDEPTVGLDPGQRVRAREIVKRVGEEIPVLLSTHLVEDVSFTCSSVGVLVEGRLGFQGSVDAFEELGRHDVTGAERPGSRFEQTYEALVERIAGHGH